ncbi:MAG TPA: HmuY family protein [Gemmatimonadaceae bacterium]|nr:HmuY family protein [Gemmatimonadaceae bacterium]
MPRRVLRPLSVAVLLSALVACDSVTDPPALVEGEFTVNASSAWQYVSLSDSAMVSPGSPRESNSWDIAFFATNVTLNGGAAGPGGVSAACLCQNASATDAQILAMTADSELADFESVTSVPAGLTFTTDVPTPAMSGWYTGTGASATADPSKVFLVRLSDGTSFAKVHVTGITDASAAAFSSVTLEYAVQASSTAAFGATKTIAVNANENVDLNTDAQSVNSPNWDIRLEGTTLLVNSGVTGPGMVGVADGTTTFEATTTASTQPQAYRTDRFAGAFGTAPWYRYNILGDNVISPTFDVYLIKRGSAVYKLQILDYYGETGAPRQITFRYQQIAG